MSDALHPLIERAAQGELPVWSMPTSHRLGHMQRVAALLGEWADALKLGDIECARWRAIGLLHDVLREVAPEELRPTVDPSLRTWPGKLLHGPAAAERLRAEGLDDESFLLGVAYHTVGHPQLDEMGRALFIADYIEPGRTYDVERLADWRARMPHERKSVLRAVLRARLDRLLNESRPIRAETAAFWNVLSESGDESGDNGKSNAT
jgi:HD superfamily phosphohydrolase YqeK